MLHNIISSIATEGLPESVVLIKLVDYSVPAETRLARVRMIRLPFLDEGISVSTSSTSPVFKV
jgi:hypothetical protein